MNDLEPYLDEHLNEDELYPLVVRLAIALENRSIDRPELAPALHAAIEVLIATWEVIQEPNASILTALSRLDVSAVIHETARAQRHAQEI